MIRSFVSFFFLLSSFTLYSQDTLTQTQSNTRLDMCREAYFKGKIEGPSQGKPEQRLDEVEKVYSELHRKLAQEDCNINWRSNLIKAFFLYIPTTILLPFGTRILLASLGLNQNGAGDLAFVSLMTSIVRKPIEDGMSTLSSILENWSKEENSLEWNAELEIRSAQYEYKDLKKQVPDSHQVVIEDQFKNLFDRYIKRTVALTYNLHQNDGVRKTVTESLKRIDRILSIPREIKKIKVDDAKLNELTANFSKSVQGKIKEFAHSIAYQSSEVHPPDKRTVLYLQGSPGTGKTYLMERFADIFYKDESDRGLPIIEISLEDVKSLSDLIGQPRTREEILEGVTAKVSKLSHALTSLPKDKQYKNAIIVLDEADKFLNGEQSAMIRTYFTKEIFNRNTIKLKLHDLGVEVDFSRYHFILIGNSQIFDASNAFMDRVTVVKFPAFEADKRLNIACTEFGKSLSQISHVTDSDEHLKLILDGVDKDQERKPGVRTLLKTITEFTDHLRNPENLNKPFPFLERLDANTQVYSDPYSLYEMTLQKFERIKDTLLPSLQKDIEGHLDFLKKDKLLNEALRPDNKQDRIDLENYLKNIDTLMNFPSSIRKLSDEETVIMKQVNELLRLYPESVQKPIRDLVQIHIGASLKGSLDRSIQKNVLYLWGAPGTGKSYLAEGLAKAMNLNLIQLEFKSGKVDEILKSEKYYSFRESTQEELSPFTQNFLNNGKTSPEKNSVVYINEIDKMLNSRSGSSEANIIKSVLLDLLDADKKEFTLKDLRSNLDISRYLFVLVGNDLIESDGDYSPMDDRMTLVEFKGFGLEAKIEIAQKFFESQLKSMNLSASDTEKNLVTELMKYSHLNKHQVSLRTPFKVIELYINWLLKREGTFDYKDKLDSFSRHKEVTPKH